MFIFLANFARGSKKIKANNNATKIATCRGMYEDGSLAPLIVKTAKQPTYSTKKISNGNKPAAP